MQVDTDFDRLTRLLSESCAVPAEEIGAGTKIIEELGLASLEIVMLAAQIERQWAVRFRDGDANGLVTVGDVLALIEKRRA